MINTRNFTIWFAWRQLIAKKGQSLSFMTLISILGITIGVATLMIVLSIMGGMSNNLRNELFRGLPHLEVYAKNPLAGFSLTKLPKQAFHQAAQDIIELESFIKANVVIKKGKNIAPITLLGIEPKKKGAIWNFHQALVEGSFKHLEDGSIPSTNSESSNLPGLILGHSLALRIDAKVDDLVHILSPQVSFSQLLSGAKISTLFQVKGIFFADSQRYDKSFALTSLQNGRKFLLDYDPSLDEERYVSGIAVRLKHPDFVDQYKLPINDSQLMIKTWKDVNKSFLFALKLEKYTMGSILFLIVLVAAFSISATMMMTVFHKKNQIALLRSLGMSKLDITKLFITHGTAIGLIGVTGGLLSGIGICFALHYGVFTNFLRYFNQQSLPVAFLPFEYTIIALSAWFLSLLAAVYPAIIAARQSPSEGLRFT